MNPFSSLHTLSVQVALCFFTLFASGCSVLHTKNDSSINDEANHVENEMVTGVWIFEDEQIEIKLAKVDNAKLLPAPTRNATRFTIASTADKLVKYKTEQFKIDEQRISDIQKTRLSGRPFLNRLDKEMLRGDAVQSSFRGSVAMHRDIPVEFTIQNTDINSDTPYIYSRISMQVIAREYTGDSSFISNIECVSFPQFFCSKVAAPQRANLN